ncbi:hypothetical protein [Pseudoduganella namucuonensis]|uniref:hypothetical protein n=1 Tax=Pseudoduganella namucuonensis TaxID=1035707 RepID=UPI0015A708C4|nr:hypothetical protein [Pseudoduganella namucuonensis]
MDNDRIRQLMRAWMARRRVHPEPLPSLEQIRHAVGWAEEGPPQDDTPAAMAGAIA